MAALPTSESSADPAVSGEVATWLDAIERAERDQQPYQQRCDRILKRYLFEGANKTARQFQILWANQEILRPAVYAKRPNPVVQSRFKDGDPVARLASQLLERTLDVQFDLGDYDHAFRLVRNDYLLFARGVPRIRYEAEFEIAEDDSETSDEGSAGAADPTADPGGDDSDPTEDATPAEPQERLKAEHVKLDFVHRRDLIHPQARQWMEVPWVAYRAFLSRRELQDRWPKLAKAIVLDAKGDDSSREEGRNPGDSAQDKATIFEIWDKVNRRVLWIAKGFPDVLEEGPPYLTLTGFFPSPRPAYGTVGDKLNPVPDFVFYQDQADEINKLTARIDALSDALKLVGFYEAGPWGGGAPARARGEEAGV